MLLNLLNKLSKKIAIDLGTATVIIYESDKGIVLQEPSFVALDKDTKKIIAVGEEARRMLGRTPANIEVIRPLKDGVIANFEVAEMMLKSFLKKVGVKSRFIKPLIMVCIPVGVTGVESRAVLEAAVQVGARKAFLIEEPVAAAIGAGLQIEKPEGNMIIDIGGGTTEIAVLSLGGIVVGKSIRVGGDKFDEALVRYVREHYNLVIGEATAEEIKLSIGSADPNFSAQFEVKGRDLMTGLPRHIELTAEETYTAFKELLDNIAQAARRVLEQTPPELSADIVEKGIILTGGGSLLKGLDKFISQRTEVGAFVTDDPLVCVAEGTGQALNEIDKISNVLSTGDQSILS
ncbi:rod shape-determining protein [Halanaerobium praevalens]|uniref:Cell shape-determining protein MreB n=1 Tax=Halanaerobium praevalens (strain ATCC 33744 / DSM 2228 / GSL) TaxID=572479 RepID=E3DRE6_HALPG|nr:rod shape-determining protein [Halanaerobium praevalens]ADO78078.1 rod shape-determining protein MreB [Halanaerobium praevalens DSM 2228]